MAASTNLADLRAQAKLDLARRKELVSTLISKRDVAPFQTALAGNIVHADSINWRSLAKRDPFKYIQCMEKLAVMSGYVFDGLHSGPTVVVVEGMADNELVRALAAARAKTLALPLTIDQSPAPAETGIYKVYPEPAPDSEATSVPASPEQESCQPSEPPTSVPNERSRAAGGTGSETE